MSGPGAVRGAADVGGAAAADDSESGSADGPGLGDGVGHEASDVAADGTGRDDEEVGNAPDNEVGACTRGRSWTRFRRFAEPSLNLIQ